MSERVNARLKDEFGGRNMRVRGAAKVMTISCSAFWHLQSINCCVSLAESLARHDLQIQLRTIPFVAACLFLNLYPNLTSPASRRLYSKQFTRLSSLLPLIFRNFVKSFTPRKNNYYSHLINDLNHSFHMWKIRFPPPACYLSAGSPAGLITCLAGHFYFLLQETTMTPRSIRRAAEREANKVARKAAANRENAQLSTGPVTEAGKAKSSLNALKSALTGRTVLLSTDDAAQYQTHIQSYEDHFNPVGPEEQALVQSLADTSWRLARIPGLEMALYAQGRIEFSDEFEEQDEAVRPALIEAQTYLAYEKQIRNLHLQEARLVRRREKETAELSRLQQERIAKEVREAAQPNRNPITPEALAEFSFDFSTYETGGRLPSTGSIESHGIQANAA
jgi:hypothetical protein